MRNTHFYALWSLHEAPRQFISNVSRKSYQVQMPLPLPKQLVVFSVGEWTSFSCGTTVMVEVLVSPEGARQKIGTLSPNSRCLVWEGDWTLELLAESAENSRRGVYAKVVLTVCGEVRASFISSTPLVTRKRPASRYSSSLCQTLLGSGNNNNVISQRSLPEDTVCYAELQSSKGDIQNTSLGVWAMDKTPRQTVIGKRGPIWNYEELETPHKSRQTSSRKKLRLSVSASQNEGREFVKRRRTCRTDHPSKRWNHSMCLSDCDTAIVIGGEAADQAHCADFIWKLEIDGDFWFPMDSASSGPLPPSAQGHSAAFDPESKVVYVYGGLREGQRYNDIYMLNTLTWKWKLIHAKGNVPSLAYHSSTIYKRELYVFGGLQPSRGPAGKACSNALYIFNPEHELWYQPIVEGERPLPRFGHSTTLLPDKLVIFGGQKTAAYLNDLHILDLGFMEYIAVKYESMPPLARGIGHHPVLLSVLNPSAWNISGTPSFLIRFHAALPVSNNRVLISGGCSAVGALQDLHLFNLDTNSWASLACPLLCSKPRAGHSLLSLSGTAVSDREARGQGDPHHISPAHYTILVFGGSDCAGKFYDDAVKCVIEIPTEGQGEDIKV